VGATLISLVGSVVKIIRMPRTEPMSQVKVAVTLGLLGLLVAGGTLIPFPWFTQAPFVIEPIDVQHVYAITPGAVLRAHVQPGDIVAAEDLLMELENPQLEDEVRALTVRRDAQATVPVMYEKVDDPVNRAFAAEELRELDRQLAQAIRQREQLVLRAPVAGVVVAPPFVREPTLTVLKERLPAWHGTPLDPRNVGAALEERTHICSIAPVESFRAVLLIDQADRDDLIVGRSVRMKLEHLPHLKLTGRVVEISDRHREFAPPALSNKYGGQLPTVSDSQGREKLTSIVYQAIVEVELDHSLLRSGMRGTARFVIARRSAAMWIWRALRQTFHFRL
jgi:putative peptide zinc metalloprotease protein